MIFVGRKHAPFVMSTDVAFDLFHDAIKERVRISAERIDQGLMVKGKLP